VLLPEMGTAYQEIAVLDLRDGRTALRASNLVYLYGGHGTATASWAEDAELVRRSNSSTIDPGPCPATDCETPPT